MEEDLISIIIPVYNVENEIEKCIRSIQNQTYHNIEIIIINDGSTDNSLTKCHELSENDERIRVFSKINGGLSSARNFGLEKVNGKFVSFIDGDDYVEEDFLYQLIKSLKYTNSDVAMSGFYKVYDNRRKEKIKIPFLNKQINVICGRELLKRVFEKNGYVYVVVWNKLYKKELFETHKFKEGLLYEDEFMSFELFWNVKKVCLINNYLYNYIQRSNSIMGSSISKEKVFSRIKLHFDRANFYKSKDKILFQKSQNEFRNYLENIGKETLKELNINTKYFHDLQKMFRKSVKEGKFRPGINGKIKDMIGIVNFRILTIILKKIRKGK